MLANAQKERERQREREQQREQQEYLLQQQERLLHQQQQQQQQQQLLQQQLLQQRLREEEARQQRLLYQQEQLAAQQQQQAQVQRLLLQQRDQLQQQHTPPPRMISSQSPRFLEHQRQLLILQQQKEQQQRLQDLQDQARFEELERRMAAVNMERTRGSDPVFNDRHTPNFSVAELQEAQRLQLLQQAAQERQFLLQQQQQQQYRRQGSRSPAVSNKAQYAAALQEAMPQFQNQNVQLQQRLLADLAHGDFPRDVAGSHAEQEALRMEAMRKILEAEKMEEKRRRKAAKIAHMVRPVYLSCFPDAELILPLLFRVGSV